MCLSHTQNFRLSISHSQLQHPTLSKIGCSGAAYAAGMFVEAVGTSEAVLEAAAVELPKESPQLSSLVKLANEASAWSHYRLGNSEKFSKIVADARALGVELKLPNDTPSAWGADGKMWAYDHQFVPWSMGSKVGPTVWPKFTTTGRDADDWVADKWKD